MVLKLKMPMKQKLGVAAMFALGFFVVISSSEFIHPLSKWPILTYAT